MAEVIEQMKKDLEYARKRDVEQRLEPLMTETREDLLLYEEKDPEKLEQGSYRYIITSGACSHTAFHTGAGLVRWLTDTGIKVGAKIERLHNTNKLLGKYTVISMSGNQQKLDAFAKRKKLESTKILSNGEYTRAYIKRKGGGGNTIYHLNPNYPREVLPYEQE